MFAFVATTADYLPSDKERLLTQVLQHLKPHLPNIKITLADKDVTEISAFRIVFPDAKHQSCFWHAKEYVKLRLTENKPPAAYNPRLAQHHFEFIDPTWAPGVTAQPRETQEEGVHPHDYKRSLKEPTEVSNFKLST